MNVFNAQKCSIRVSADSFQYTDYNWHESKIIRYHVYSMSSSCISRGLLKLPYVVVHYHMSKLDQWNVEILPPKQFGILTAPACF